MVVLEVKVLAATAKTQGQRSDDFCWTLEGELVIFPPIECIDATLGDECGCSRAMAGLASHRATTTIEVVDRQELNRDVYAQVIRDGLAKQGYLRPDATDPELEDWLGRSVAELIRLATPFAPGTVLERRGDYLLVRRPHPNSATDAR